MNNNLASTHSQALMLSNLDIYMPRTFEGTFYLKSNTYNNE